MTKAMMSVLTFQEGIPHHMSGFSSALQERNKYNYHPHASCILNCTITLILTLHLAHK